MANKKILAYAKLKDGSDNFIFDEKGQLKYFYIWQALKLKKSNFFEFDKLIFFSTQQNESNRTKMTTVTNGFFRYVGDSGRKKGFIGDGESLSHSIAIRVLSELDTINFVFGKKECLFSFSEMKIEENIKFGTGKAYIPDLVGFFSPGNPYYEKWGGKVAIEVKVTHECEQEKITDFLDHNIPIIEINVTKKTRFQKELHKKPFDENDLEDYYNWLESIFSNKVYGKILSDPTSRQYNKKIMLQVKKGVYDLKEKLTKSEQLSVLLKNKLDIKENESSDTRRVISDRDERIKELSNTLEQIKNRTLFQKMADVFRH